ncbi:MAG: CHRD domain-containing protein, partial [Dinghuibacter sp.]|nr:CHRD domain-containing protein [Dinghuibacter sp.]
MKMNRFLIAMMVVASGFFFTACEEDIEESTLTKTTTMTGDQEVPAVTTTGSASLSYTYNKSTKTLTYTLTWANLVDSVTAMHIHGLAGRGQNAGVLQGFTLSTVQRRKEGTYTGSVYFDGL